MVRVVKIGMNVALVLFVYFGLTSLSESNDRTHKRKSNEDMEEVITVMGCARSHAASRASRPWFSIAGGGTIHSASSDMRFSASVGQPVIGPIQETDHTLHFGFWNSSLFTVDVEQERGELLQPGVFKLMQNYPNPFNPTTDIRYQISDRRYPVHITLQIFNILGQEVQRLVDEVQKPGYYTVTWDGCNTAGQKAISGIYFYRLTVTGGQWVETKKMVLLK